MFKFLRPKAKDASKQKSQPAKVTLNPGQDLSYARMRAMVVHGDLPISLVDAVHLAVLAWKADSGTVSDSKAMKDLESKVLAVLPPDLVKAGKTAGKLIADQAKEVVKLSAYDAMVEFGEVFRKLPSFGLAWFRVEEKGEKETKGPSRWLGISDETIRLLDGSTLELRRTMLLADLKRFAASPAFITLDLEPNGRLTFYTNEAHEMETILTAYLERLWKRKRAEARRLAIKKAQETNQEGETVGGLSEESADSAGSIEGKPNFLDIVTSLLDLLSNPGSQTAEDLRNLRILQDAFGLMKSGLASFPQLQDAANRIMRGMDALMKDMRGSVDMQGRSEIVAALQLDCLHGMNLLLQGKGDVVLGPSAMTRAADILAGHVKDLLANGIFAGNAILLERLQASLAKTDLAMKSFGAPGYLALRDAAIAVANAITALQQPWLENTYDEENELEEALILDSLLMCLERTVYESATFHVLNAADAVAQQIETLVRECQ